jgi:hypothetical protein
VRSGQGDDDERDGGEDDEGEPGDAAARCAAQALVELGLAALVRGPGDALSGHRRLRRRRAEPAEDLRERRDCTWPGEGGSAASCGAIVCSVVIDPGVTPRTSQRRSSPLPISTVTMRCEVESGSIATLFITPAPPRRRAACA